MRLSACIAAALVVAAVHASEARVQLVQAPAEDVTNATTVAPTTLAPTTEAPTTVAPTTEAPTTVAPTTVAPTTTAVPTTEAPTTAAPTTEVPTTAAPTTEAPTTAAPTTAKPTDAPTDAPTTAKPTDAPITQKPTDAPVTPAPTDAPVTPAPTDAPVTPKPTDAPVTPKPTDAPVTPAPTDAPVTPKPTDAPVTPVPTDAPVTPKPTDAPITPVPTPGPTDTPITPKPTDAPITPVPTPGPTDAPITPVPTPGPTDAPVTPVPTPGPTDAPITPKPTDPTPTDAPTAAPSDGPKTTPVPTQIQLVTPAPTETKSAIIDNLLTQTKAPEDTPEPTNNALFTVKDTPLPTTIAAVVTADPNDISKLNGLGDLGTTVPPKGGSGSGSKELVESNDHSNRNRGKAPSEQTTNAETKRDVTTGVESTGEQTVRYITSAVIGISVVILAFFQFIAMNPSYIVPDLADRVFAPNSWELPLFVAFVQQVGALSLVRNAIVPQLFYMNFLDSLSWLSYLIMGSSTSAAASTSAISSVQLISARQLAETTSGYDASGFTQFASRSGVKERDWFVRVWVAFFIVLAVVLVLVIATALFAKWASQRGNPFSTDSSDSHKRSVNLRSISRRLLGMCVLLAYLVLLPLSMISMFELLQDASTTGFPHAAAIFAIVTLVLLVAVVGAGMYFLAQKSEAGLSKWQTRVVWGVVYTNYSYTNRLFLGASAAVQILTGVLVAAVTADPLTQLLVLIVLHVVYLGAIVVLRPFECPVHMKFAVAFELLIVTIYAVACGMTGADLTKATQTTLSYVVLVIVCVVVVAIFIRQLVMLWTYSSGWAKAEEDGTYSGIPTLNDHDMESGPGQYTISLHGTDSGNSNNFHALNTNQSRDDVTSPTNTIRIVDTTKQIQI